MNIAQLSSVELEIQAKIRPNSELDTTWSRTQGVEVREGVLHGSGPADNYDQLVEASSENSERRFVAGLGL